MDPSAKKTFCQEVTKQMETLEGVLLRANESDFNCRDSLLRISEGLKKLVCYLIFVSTGDSGTFMSPLIF